MGPQMANLKIIYRKPAALKPRPTSPRTHSKKQIEQIAASICEFGFTNPLLIDREERVIAGHGRLEVDCDAGPVDLAAAAATIVAERLEKRDAKLGEHQKIDSAAVAEILTLCY